MKSKGIQDYEVGYGKPPVEARFKKGQSGNPRGRPRHVRNIEELTEQQLDRMVTIEDAGQRRHMSKRELGLAVLIKKALAGNPKAMRMIYKMLRQMDPRSSAPAFLTKYFDPQGRELSAKSLADLQSGKRPPRW